MKRNVMKNGMKTGAIALAALSLAGAANAQMTRVEVNGQPLQMSVEQHVCAAAFCFRSAGRSRGVECNQSFGEREYGWWLAGRGLSPD